MDEQAEAQALAQAQIFHNVNRELTNVSQTLTTQGILNIVPTFHGNAKHYRE